MQGIRFGNTFEGLDGQKYNKNGTDARKSKVYLRCVLKGAQLSFMLEA